MKRGAFSKWSLFFASSCMPWGQSAEILKHVRFIHRIIVADSSATPFTSKKKLKMRVMHNIIKFRKDFKRRREYNKNHVTKVSSNGGLNA